MKDSIGIGVETGDLAQVGDARDLGHFHAVVELFRGIVQKAYWPVWVSYRKPCWLVVESP